MRFISLRSSSCQELEAESSSHPNFEVPRVLEQSQVSVFQTNGLGPFVNEPNPHLVPAQSLEFLAVVLSLQMDSFLHQSSLLKTKICLEVISAVESRKEVVKDETLLDFRALLLDCERAIKVMLILKPKTLT